MSKGFVILIMENDFNNGDSILVKKLRSNLFITLVFFCLQKINVKSLKELLIFQVTITRN